MDSNELNAYHAAYETAAFYVIPDAGCLRIEGEDRQTFLQRQTSNDVRRLAPGQVVLTVLTSATARIVDVLYLLPEDNAITVLTLPGRGGETGKFLRSRIFFMDKVNLVDASPAVLQIDLFGPQAPQVLAHLGIVPATQVDHLVEQTWQAHLLRVFRMQPAFGLGYRLVAAQEALPSLRQALVEAGAVLADPNVVEVLRVEAGLPAAGAELTESYTPLEAGLKMAISESKGCYTGQEVIARQITYDKVTQHLAGVRLGSPAQSGERLYTPTGDPAGSLTSVVDSPRLGALALAVIKRAYCDPGTELRVGGADGHPAVVTSLPFQ